MGPKAISGGEASQVPFFPKMSTVFFLLASLANPTAPSLCALGLSFLSHTYIERL